MKHAGPNEALRAQAARIKAGWPPWRGPLLNPGAQSLTSRLALLAAALFLVAIVVDAPVHRLSETLDPSAVAALRCVTEFGNSAWPVGIGLLLLGLVEILRRSGGSSRPDALSAWRSVLILLVVSVVLSGTLASVTKHVIGRIRPSADPDAMVLEFSFMAFKSGWAAFPSGHATTATAAAVALALCFPRQAWAWLAVGALAAFSRALLGVHWVSDCLAGMGLGAVVTILLFRRMTATGHQFTIPVGTTFGLARDAFAALQTVSVGAARRLVKALTAINIGTRRL